VTRLSRRLTSLSRGWVVLAALALFVVFMVFVLPAQAEVSSRELDDAGSPDMSFVYSAGDLYRWAEAYGPDGRAAYVRVRWSFDLAWPLVYGLFLVTAVSWLGRRAYPSDSRWRLLNLTPVVAVLLDYAENVLTSVVMLRYPSETVVAASLASPVTIAKWIFVGVGFAALLTGLLTWLWRGVRA
jgi:hypothetical protein